jgi:hypothetical protein
MQPRVYYYNWVDTSAGGILVLENRPQHLKMANQQSIAKYQSQHLHVKLTKTIRLERVIVV